MSKVYLTAAIACLLLLASCERVSSRGPSAILEVIDAQSDIYGNWRAEQLSIGGLGLPIAPSLEFTREHVVLEGKITRAEKYEVREKSEQNPRSITIHLADGPSLTFDMIDSETMSFKLPVGAVKYKKVR